MGNETLLFDNNTEKPCRTQTHTKNGRTLLNLFLYYIFIVGCYAIIFTVFNRNKKKIQWIDVDKRIGCFAIIIIVAYNYTQWFFRWHTKNVPKINSSQRFK